MNMAVADIAPEIGELNVSNQLIGDPEALKAAWDRDGYWFFRDVLDKQEIAKIRQVYVDYLVEMGVVDAGDPEARWNGADLSALPVNSNLTKLNDCRADKLLHRSAPINAFFARLFDCEPCWIPFTVHRTNPPVADRSRSRFDFIHHDGIYNAGLPFLICWVPLDDIDEEVGGIAVVEGVHHQPTLHRKDGMKIIPIRFEDVPVGHWRSAHFRAGDVLLMGMETPHSGLANLSKDRFRFSMDTRIMPSTGNCPAVGAIAEVSTEGVTVTTANGDRKLHFDTNSFVRGHHGDQMPLADVPGRYHVGDEVIVMTEGDRVINLRPQT